MSHLKCLFLRNVRLLWHIFRFVSTVIAVKMEKKRGKRPKRKMFEQMSVSRQIDKIKFLNSLCCSSCSPSLSLSVSVFFWNHNLFHSARMGNILRELFTCLLLFCEIWLIFRLIGLVCLDQTDEKWVTKWSEWMNRSVLALQKLNGE